MKKCLVFSLALLSAFIPIPLLSLPMAAISPAWQGVWLEITTGFEPYPRSAHSAVWDSYGNEMIVFGGCSHDSQGRTIGLNDIWMYNPVSNTWSRGSDAPMTRGTHVAVWDTQNNQMIVYGGESVYASYQYYQDTWTYNPTTNTWTQRADGPGRRNWATGVWDLVHDQMIMFGGYHHPTDSALGDTWAYVPLTDTWVRKTDGPGARLSHMAVWNSKDNVMIVFGGRSLTYGQYGSWNDTWVYDPQMDQWFQKANMPSPLANACAVWDPIHNVVIVFGGELQTPAPAGETWIYDPASDKWEVLDIEARPSPRDWLQAIHVWDSINNQLILFGGNAGAYYLNDLWIFKIARVEPTKWAVVIGVDEYWDSELNSWGGPGNSAKDMYNILVDYMSFPPDHIHLLVDEIGVGDDDVTRAIVEDELAWLQTVAIPKDIVVFYYAGHGGQSQPLEYIQMHDTIMWDEDFAVKTDKIQSQNLVVILDISFSGGFITDGQTLWQGILGIAPSWTDLAQETPSGRIVLTACAENVGPWLRKIPLRDAREWPFTLIRYEMVFTHYLVQGFKGSADYNFDGKVTVEEAFRYARRHSLWSQTPMIYDGYPEYEGEGELYLGD